MCFKRIFVALKPCIDGFLAGCRPYIGVDQLMHANAWRLLSMLSSLKQRTENA